MPMTVLQRPVSPTPRLPIAGPVALTCSPFSLNHFTRTAQVFFPAIPSSSRFALQLKLNVQPPSASIFTPDMAASRI